MSERLQRLRLRQLDEALKEWKHLPRRPAVGWIRVIRRSLGMTLPDLARRLGLSFQALSQFERAERDGTITLSSLQKIADALACDLVYGLVPRESLQAVLESEANQRARRIFDRVRHSMSLEGQDISEEEARNQLGELTQELLAGNWRKVWKI